MAIMYDELHCVHCGHVSYDEAVGWRPAVRETTIGPQRAGRPRVERQRAAPLVPIGRQRTLPARECAWGACEALFWPYTRLHVYCGEGCRVSARDSRHRQGRVSRVCRHCGAVFSTYRRRHYYCCRGCTIAGGDAARRARRRKIPSPGVCDTCGSGFLTIWGNKRYCSKQCRDRGYRLRWKRRERWVEDKQF